MTKRSIDAHELILRRRGGQWSATCRCALMPRRESNDRDSVVRKYDDHVLRSERAARRRTAVS